MAFIGNTPTQQAFTPAVDFFNGNGSTTAFTLSRPVASVAQVQAVISNVPQKPGDAFTVSGNTITFTSAPPSGTNNIYVYYTSPITQVIAPGQGTVGSDQLQSSINITTLSTTNGATVQGLTVGRGAGAVSTNTAVGASALAANTTGSSNVAMGYQAAFSNTTGTSIDAFGTGALYANTTGTNNAGFAAGSLVSNTTGSSNSAFGRDALRSNTTASYNTAVGYQAGYSNTTGTQNVFQGSFAGYNNTTGSYNTSLGYNAYAVSGTAATGSYNTAIGNGALNQNTTGNNNTAVGYQAVYSNSTGSGLTAVGYQAGYSNTTGVNNVCFGLAAGSGVTTGNRNTLIGSYTGYSLSTGGGNTFVGTTGATDSAGCGFYMTTGSNNTIIGGFTGNAGGLDIRTASNNIVLSDGAGNPKLYYQSANTRWILQDQFWPTGLRSGAGTNTAKYNTGTGELTYDTSSARYKDNIRDSVYGLSHVMQMRSAQFEYKDDGRSDVGLIAEELQPIIPELVGVNKEGQADSVSYDRMVSVLVKAIQELKAEFDAYKEAHP